MRPALRVEYSNMEIAAAAAPRPQILVAASGDWTKDTLTVEGPAIERIYHLLNAQDQFRLCPVRFRSQLQPNQPGSGLWWFNKWLLKKGSGKPLPEQPYHKEADADLRVFPSGQIPPGALTQDQLITQLKALHRNEWERLAPSTRAGLQKYRETLLPAWRHTVQLDAGADRPVVVTEPMRECGEFTGCAVGIKRPGETTQIMGTYWAPASILTDRSPKLAVLCSPEPGTQAALPAPASPAGLALQLLKHGIAVLQIDRYSATTPDDQFSKFFATYNRTLLQERVPVIC